MSKYKAKYDAESDVPDEVKPFYKVKDGKWIFEGGEFDGLAELLNPGLATNKEAILQEKRTAVEAKELAEAAVTRLEAEVKTLKKPGTVAISDSDFADYNSYKELGPVKDIKTKLDNEQVLTQQVATISSKEEIRTLAKKLNLNEDALIDLKLNQERGKGLEFAAVKFKTKDDKGTEVEEEDLAIVITQTVDGKEKKKETRFSEYAKSNNYPDYIVDAIYKNGNGKEEETTKKSPFKMPRTITSKTEDDDANKSSTSQRVQKFNERRSTRKMPWSRQTQTDIKE